MTFVNNNNPYAEDEDLNLVLAPPGLHATGERPASWGQDTAYKSSTSEVAAHGLEALSAAASRDGYSFLPHESTTRHAMMPSQFHYAGQEITESPTAASRSTHAPPPSPYTTNSGTNNNINFILNPATSMSPVIDPNLQSPMDQRPFSITTSALMAENPKQDMQSEQPVEVDHEVAFLLRNFRETQGQ